MEWPGSSPGRPSCSRISYWPCGESGLGGCMAISCAAGRGSRSRWCEARPLGHRCREATLDRLLRQYSSMYCNLWWRVPRRAPDPDLLPPPGRLGAGVAQGETLSRALANYRKRTFFLLNKRKG